ncbi:MAG TPA: sigma-70 family RNA polymerase sigma factor [Leucothrix mucor]|nr:sigma-70 family RNA polymerase sigma factor [Leucothrix mucor]
MSATIAYTNNTIIPDAELKTAELTPTIYPELKRLAARHMFKERIGHTITPTVLVNETYLKLLKGNRLKVVDKHHFLAISSRCMRQILVDYSRERNALKRGGSDVLLTLKEELAESNDQETIDVLQLDNALQKLELRDPVQVRIVELRFFSGMTNIEISEVLGISPATIKRKWALAKAWLYREMA